MVVKAKKSLPKAPLNIKRVKMSDGKAKKRIAKPAESMASSAKKETKKNSKKKSYLTNLSMKRTRNFGIGMDIQPKRNMTRFLRWPKYVRIQRQEEIIKKRMKIPPSINQFKLTLNRNLTLSLFGLLHKYRPETKQARKLRLKRLATQLAVSKKSTVTKSKSKKSESGKKTEKVGVKKEKDATTKKAVSAEKVETTDKKKKTIKKPTEIKVKKVKKYIRTGIHEVTSMVEKKKAKLVVIPHDVDPIEIVVWLPALCRKMNVPYCIVKSKSRLGKIARGKTVSCLCLTDVKRKDQVTLKKLIDCIRPNFNDRTDEVRRMWGGGIKNRKSLAKTSL